LNSRLESNKEEEEGYHQPPDVNYIELLAKVDFPCRVNAFTLQGQSNFAENSI
jgi:hypothetical protein